jgi:hypothetical protein
VKITPEYRELNRKLHEHADYGISGESYAPFVMGACKLADSREILDYGCGKRTLEKALGFPIQNYDPCIEGLDAAPAPRDVVVCTDVLEHIEPECLDDVLDDLKRVTRRVGVFVIATRPAAKNLPDGRNAHLIQQPESWWIERLAARFRVVHVKRGPEMFLAVVEPMTSAP